MKLPTHLISGALLPLLVAATPATLASSSAVSAQVPVLQAALPQTMAPQTTASRPTVPQPSTIIDTDDAPPAAELPVATDPAPDRRHVECIAKIILHEAADEPRPGRVAVAQVIRARMRDGRFAADACGVARQRGQFFDVDAFRPARDSAKWQDAVAIAAATLAGEGAELVPGALFFHASYSPMPGRQRVGQIGGHVFYR